MRKMIAAYIVCTVLLAFLFVAGVRYLIENGPKVVGTIAAQTQQAYEAARK